MKNEAADFVVAAKANPSVLAVVPANAGTHNHNSSFC
jgi:hypothetical protein